MRELGGIKTDVLDIHSEQIVAGAFEAGTVEGEVCGGAFPSALAVVWGFTGEGVAGGRGCLEPEERS